MLVGDFAAPGAAALSSECQWSGTYGAPGQQPEENLLQVLVNIGLSPCAWQPTAKHSEWSFIY